MRQLLLEEHSSFSSFPFFIDIDYRYIGVWAGQGWVSILCGLLGLILDSFSTWLRDQENHVLQQE